LPRTRSSSRGVPASAARFRVDWGGPDGSDGFLGVAFQPFAADGGGEMQLTRAVRPLRPVAELRPIRPLPVARVRTVTVTLLDGRGEPVARYVFEVATPVSLALSPLNAVAGGILTETLTLPFAKVSMG